MDTVDPLRFLFSFVFVLGLIGVMAVALKRYGHVLQSGVSPEWLRRITGGKGLGGKDTVGRLAVVEVRYLDPKRRLVLVRRDDVEHLLLVADGHTLMIETGLAVKDKS